MPGDLVLSVIVSGIVAATVSTAAILLISIIRRQDTGWAMQQTARDAKACRRSVRRSEWLVGSAHRAAHRAARAAEEMRADESHE